MQRSHKMEKGWIYRAKSRDCKACQLINAVCHLLQRCEPCSLWMAMKPYYGQGAGNYDGMKRPDAGIAGIAGG